MIVRFLKSEKILISKAILKANIYNKADIYTGDSGYGLSVGELCAEILNVNENRKK